MKKLKKNVMGIVGTSMLGAAGSMALGSIGGTAATSGQKGIASATSFLPVMGTMAGVSSVLGSLPKTKHKKKKK